MEVTTELPAVSYYQARMTLLGVTDALNKVKLRYYDADKKDNAFKDYPVFRETEKGIDILVYTLDRDRINYAKEGARHKVNEYAITRLAEPIVKKDGSTLKYLMPKGQPVLPFFPPALVDKYDKGVNIPVLYITEGYFKAWAAQAIDISCVGLPSITCMKDKETGKLHGDIFKLILKCNVKRVVWLTDGDCRNITSKEITEGVDLSKRPHQFFRTVQTFYDLLSGLDNITCYYAHIYSDNLEGNPKGLDDLIAAYPNDVAGIRKEFNNGFDKLKEKGDYLVRFNISTGIGKVHRYFMLHDVDTFYLHHIEQRPELKGKDFKFFGSLYYYNDTDAKCQIKIPSSAANYFRVGDKYFEHMSIPNKHGELTRTYQRREKETIKDDNGKDIFKHIPKYKAFCTVPDHTNYQRVINSCFNIYFPFEHEIEEGDCSTTLEFLKHIFGTDTVSADDGSALTRFDIGLDYLTLLYKKPQQILPILCLVSTDRQTGKTTFAKWLNMIFTENMAIVGNDDLAAQFNAHWSSKLIIACDETKIDKHVVMEKIKNLSTAGNIMMNAKGRDQVNMEFFGKFILMSNNEDNFASIDKEEIRFWVIKVPAIQKRNVDLLDDLLSEIPAFLHYLNSRQMVTTHKERHWFDTRLLRTEALDKVVKNSRPNVEKLIIHAITELFEASELDTITMPLSAIAAEILKKPQDKDYVKRVLNQMGYKTHESQRRDYPRLVESSDTTGIFQKVVSVKFHGCYYEFHRADFISGTAPAVQPDLPF